MTTVALPPRLESAASQSKSRREDPDEIHQAQVKAAAFRQLNETLSSILRTVRSIGEIPTAGSDITPSNIYNHVYRWQGAADSLGGEESETLGFPEIQPLILKLKKKVKDVFEDLSLPKLFGLIPKTYQEFREVKENQVRFFAASATRSIAEHQLSEPEENVLLFHMLEFARQLRGELPSELNRVPSVIRPLLSRLRLMITIDEAKSLSDRTTLYVSARDKALDFSEFLHGYDRAGYSPPVTTVEGIDTVEVTNIDLTTLGHSYYGDAEAVLYDMHQLLLSNTPPENRTRLQQALGTAQKKYWVIRS